VLGRGKVWIAVSVFALLVLLGGAAYALAQGHAKLMMMGPGMMGGGMMEGMMVSEGMPMGHGGIWSGRPITLMLELKDKLGLTQDQVGKLESLRSTYQERATKNIKELRNLEVELNKSLTQEPLDLSRIEGKIKRIEALRSDMMLSRIKTIEEGKATLTLDQRKKLQELFSKAMGEGCPGMMEEMAPPEKGQT